MIIVIGLGGLLIQQILVPVYQMLKNTTKSTRPKHSENVVTALSRNVNDLLENVDQAQQELEKSRGPDLKGRDHGRWSVRLRLILSFGAQAQAAVNEVYISGHGFIFIYITL